MAYAKRKWGRKAAVKTREKKKKKKEEGRRRRREEEEENKRGPNMRDLREYIE